MLLLLKTTPFLSAAKACGSLLELIIISQPCSQLQETKGKSVQVGEGRKAYRKAPTSHRWMAWRSTSWSLRLRYRMRTSFLNGGVYSCGSRHSISLRVLLCPHAYSGLQYRGRNYILVVVKLFVELSTCLLSKCGQVMPSLWWGNCWTRVGRAVKALRRIRKTVDSRNTLLTSQLTSPRS